jgi:hypothetical protein
MLLAFVEATKTVNIPNELWDNLMNLLSSVTSNPHIIDKWIVSYLNF